ncbi:MAG: hypothetical protein H6Q90_2462 [Deltaproteobacteria bacterium]|nr:hypothetical protein [Deltaproteobacteria bacterium]
MRDLEGEAFAGEVSSLRPPARPSTWRPRLRAALGTGAKAGIVPTTIVFAIYFLAHHDDADLPWLRIASIAAVYGPLVGISLAVAVEAFVMVTERIARIGYGLGWVANPVSAGGLAGMVAGLVPGAVGVSVFGAYRGPFLGTGLIAFSLISGAGLVAVPLAIRARRARQAPDDLRVIAAASVVATLIVCAIALVLAPVIVANAFAQAQGAIDEYGAAVGALAGAAGGAVIGIYIGLVIALSSPRRRRVTPGVTAPGGRTAAPDR